MTITAPATGVISPADFTVTFSQPVSDFNTSNTSAITLGGTAGAEMVYSIVETNTSTNTYTVAVSGTMAGSITVTVDANTVHNYAGIANSTAVKRTANSVLYALPHVRKVGNSVPRPSMADWKRDRNIICQLAPTARTPRSSAQPSR